MMASDTSSEENVCPTYVYEEGINMYSGNAYKLFRIGILYRFVEGHRTRNHDTNKNNYKLVYSSCGTVTIKPVEFHRLPRMCKQ